MSATPSSLYKLASVSGGALYVRHWEKLACNYVEGAPSLLSPRRSSFACPSMPGTSLAYLTKEELLCSLAHAAGAELAMHMPKGVQGHHMRMPTYAVSCIVYFYCYCFHFHFTLSIQAYKLAWATWL